MGLIDKKLVKQRFTKAAPTYADHASVQAAVAKDLCACLASWCTQTGYSPRNVLEIGCGTGLFTQCFLSEFSPEQLIINDICENCESLAAELESPGAKLSFLAGDAEAINLGSSYDMIVSCSVFQWFENLPVFLAKAADALSERGILAFSTFVQGNLAEIESLTGTLLDYYSLDRLKEVVSEHFDIQSVQSCSRTLYFDSALDVLRHLKATGVTGVKPASFWTAAKLRDFDVAYHERFARKDGKLPLTYSPAIIIGRKA